MKEKEPTICKKFKRIFKNIGYNTFLIDEFRTSKLYNCCNNELEMFLERESHKPKLKKELISGLLKCQSIKPKCKIIYNRDKNAVQNMLNIVENIFSTGKQSDLFCRAIGS
jgi:transposase